MTVVIQEGRRDQRGQRASPFLRTSQFDAPNINVKNQFGVGKVTPSSLSDFATGRNLNNTQGVLIA